ncbi:MAG TPA: hypothetical protein VK915_04365 [Gaiellaceae bacterium]|nr:hypothetical protein [Gaiellaceae bacterium]
MAAVNGVLDDLHRSLGITDTEFFCECGRIDCKERMTLTRAEYARLREEARPVMVKAHARRGPRAAGHRSEADRSWVWNASHDATGVPEHAF